MAELLIIGGSGFVSGTLARRAIAQGHQVTIVTRGERPVPDGVTAVRADRKAPGELPAALKATGRRWDAVLDCIGFQPEDADQDLEILRKMADQLVFVSTDFVYDPERRYLPQGERQAHYQSQGYGAAKRQAELVLEKSDDHRWTVLRPGHIYGPGSKLGCLPKHSRDAQLIDRIRNGDPLELVGAGYFLQQPIFAADLADVVIDLVGREAAFGRILNLTGPDTVESAEYYRIIARHLDTKVVIREIPVQVFLADQTGHPPFICHRIYDTTALAETGVRMPSTPLTEGLRLHVESLL